MVQRGAVVLLSLSLVLVALPAFAATPGQKDPGQTTAKLDRLAESQGMFSWLPDAVNSLWSCLQGALSSDDGSYPTTGTVQGPVTEGRGNLDPDG